MRLTKRGRFWAVFDGDNALVCVTVYKKGAREVLRRLGADNLAPAEPAMERTATRRRQEHAAPAVRRKTEYMATERRA